ncbi:MAG: hypothetical protein COA39_007835 [Sulfurimonas sp.]|nr:hypothetical protein [Sulfurimonas sp.]
MELIWNERKCEEKVHQALDKAVDKCYTKKSFKNDKERIEFLFELYAEYISVS